jgi:hypothetical protein
MQDLLKTISETTGVTEEQVKGRKRISQKVSDAKIMFCRLAYDQYNKTPVEIAAFLQWPRQNIYYLLGAKEVNTSRIIG